MNKKGVTIIEIIMTVVIIVVVVMLALPNYSTMQERAKDKEAIADLRRIQEAEKFYFMQTNAYYPGAGSDSNIGNINNNLKLSLPTGASRDWNYTVNSNGCCQASRSGSGARNWYLRVTDDGRDSSSCFNDGSPESDGSVPNTTTCYVCP